MVVPGNQSPQLKCHLGQTLRALDTTELSCMSRADDAKVQAVGLCQCSAAALLIVLI